MIGSEFTGYTGIGILPIYCYGLELPLTDELFENAKNLSYLWIKSILHNNETSQRTQIMANAPLTYEISEVINNKIHLNKGPKMIFHAFHDTSIIMLLESYGIWDGNHPIFAEMVILEIYKSNVNVCLSFILEKHKNTKS